MSRLMTLEEADGFLSDSSVQKFDERGIALIDLPLWELKMLSLKPCELKEWLEELRMSWKGRDNG